jgi:hypothetical protein
LSWDNGAFFEPGTPTLAQRVEQLVPDAGGEFLTPAASGGLLSAADLAYLEAGFYHYIDDSSLGRFWFGQQKPDDTAGVPPEDVFNTFGQFGGRSGNVVVTLLGLPRLPGQGGGGAGGGRRRCWRCWWRWWRQHHRLPEQHYPSCGVMKKVSLVKGLLHLNNWQQLKRQPEGRGNPQIAGPMQRPMPKMVVPTTISFSSSVGEETLQQEAACGNNPQQ